MSLYPAPVNHPDFTEEIALYGSGKGRMKCPPGTVSATLEVGSLAPNTYIVVVDDGTQRTTGHCIVLR